ncbi:MAG: hypothetical protein KAT83_00180 [Candidatus Aenigmarchaeota archaeon]|nr:hypothetical protein [Candidatus Aenigmarchaeota archaeon]
MENSDVTIYRPNETDLAAITSGSKPICTSQLVSDEIYCRTPFAKIRATKDVISKVKSFVLEHKGNVGVITGLKIENPNPTKISYKADFDVYNI